MNKIEELLKLKELLDSGLINESDFNRKKDELFNTKNVEMNISKIDVSSKKEFDNNEIIPKPYIPENDNKQYYFIGGVIVLLIIGIILLNRNSNSENQVKPDNKIMEVKLPPKENISPVVDTNNNKSISDTVSLIQSSDGFRDPRAKRLCKCIF